jgi:DNA gyrase subunit B/topoisomerase-4 subunit B
VYFRPDASVFPKIEFDAALISERLEIASYLHKGLKVTFENEGTREKVVFAHAEGVVDYLRRIVADRGAKAVHETPFVFARDEGLRLEIVLQWTEAIDEHVRSYVNGIPTASGGTHESGLRAGIGKAVRTTCRPRASPSPPTTSAKA